MTPSGCLHAQVARARFVSVADQDEGAVPPTRALGPSTSLAINSSSAHYEAKSRGPLSWCLHSLTRVDTSQCAANCARLVGGVTRHARAAVQGANRSRLLDDEKSIDTVNHLRTWSRRPCCID
jgi:hypothetical protein